MREAAIVTIENLMDITHFKRIPGPIASYLTNSVLYTSLNYKLQTTSLNNTNYKQIETMILHTQQNGAPKTNSNIYAI